MNKEKVIALFEDANFIKELGIKPLEVKKGYVKTSVAVKPLHMQQHNFIHAAVIAAIADHSAGAAGTTLIDNNKELLTIEFKINFLKPGVGNTLYCESKVIRGGKTIIVAESNVYSDTTGADILIAKAIVTLTPVNKNQITN